MVKPFFVQLKEYFNNVGRVLKGQADVASIFPNATDVGTSRERIYSDVLRLHLPSCCTISSGGFLFDMDGNQSKQIDLIILNDTSPQFNFNNPNGQGKSFACIDGCIAIASIKSNLDSNNLIDALNNIASIPNKSPFEGKHNPLFKINNYEDWPYKIIYASAGVSLETALNTIKLHYENYTNIPLNKRPNIIHVCGKYSIIRVGKNVTTRDGRKIEENSFWGQPDSSDSYALLITILEIQTRALSSNQIFFNYADLVNRLPF